MTTVQKLTVKLSSMRSRLNELAALDTLAGPEQNEIEELREKFGATESQLRAAITAEGEEENRALGQFEGEGGGEGAEKKKLLKETRMLDYLGPVAGGVGLQGRAAELNASLDVGISERGGVLVPWAVLAGSAGPQTEKRALTTTTNLDGGIESAPYPSEIVWGRGGLDVLGVMVQDAVPAGRAEWPLITNGVAPAQVAEGTAAADAVAVTFAKEVLKAEEINSGQVRIQSHELSSLQVALVLRAR